MAELELGLKATVSAICAKWFADFPARTKPARRKPSCARLGAATRLRQRRTIRALGRHFLCIRAADVLGQARRKSGCQFRTIFLIAFRSVSVSVEHLARKLRQFLVACKPQRHQLANAEFRNPRTQIGGKELLQPQPHFQANHAVLHRERKDPRIKESRTKATASSSEITACAENA